jgi:hypothetical protein
MLYLNKSRIVSSKPMKVSPGVTITDEGQALVIVNSSGEATVKPSTGGAGEVLAGFAAFERRAPTQLATVLRYVGTGAIQTFLIPNYINGSALITKNGGQALAGTPEASIASDGTVTLTTNATAGMIIEVTAAYIPTVQDIERLVGSIWQTSTVLTAGAQVGCCYMGELWISNFDTAVAWVAGAIPKLGPNGILTTGGSGTPINGFVTHAPTVAQPYLGIDLR